MRISCWCGCCYYFYLHFIVSPYVRTVETFHGMVAAWCDPSEFHHIAGREQRIKAWYAKLRTLGLTWHEDPRIREQDFGNYQDPDKIQQAKRDRHRFGAFYYRFPYGESASDVCSRNSVCSPGWLHNRLSLTPNDCNDVCFTQCSSLTTRSTTVYRPF
jgi:hypothetical protein